MIGIQTMELCVRRRWRWLEDQASRLLRRQARTHRPRRMVVQQHEQPPALQDAIRSRCQQSRPPCQSATIRNQR